MHITFGQLEKYVLKEQCGFLSGYVQSDRVIAGIICCSDEICSEIRDRLVILTPEFYRNPFAWNEILPRIRENDAAAIVLVNEFRQIADVSKLVKQCEQIGLPMLSLPADINMFSLMSANQIFRISSKGQILGVPDMMNILHQSVDKERVKGLLTELNKWLFCQVIISIRDDVYAEPPLDNYDEAYYVPSYWKQLTVPSYFCNLKNFHIEQNDEYCLRSSVFYDGYLIGTITLIRQSYNFDEQEMQITDYASLLCAGLNFDSGRSKRIIELLAAAYEEKVLPEEDISFLPERFYALVLRSKQSETDSDIHHPTNDFLGYLIHRRFNEVLFSFIRVRGNEFDLLVVTPATNIADFSAQMLQLMKMNKRDFLIGISEPSSPPGLTNAFAEAKHAVNIGQYMSPGQDTFFYRELGIYRFFNYPEYSTLVDKIMNGMQEKLNIMDPEKSMILTDTLTCFVKNDFNYAKTADEMFTHANTIRYRIGQIEQLWDMDFRKDEDRDLFRIMYRLLPIWKKIHQH